MKIGIQLVSFFLKAFSKVFDMYPGHTWIWIYLRMDLAYCKTILEKMVRPKTQCVHPSIVTGNYYPDQHPFSCEFLWTMLIVNASMYVFLSALEPCKGNDVEFHNTDIIIGLELDIKSQNKTGNWRAFRQTREICTLQQLFAGYISPFYINMNGTDDV